MLTHIHPHCPLFAYTWCCQIDLEPPLLDTPGGLHSIHLKLPNPPHLEPTYTHTGLHTQLETPSPTPGALHLESPLPPPSPDCFCAGGWVKEHTPPVPGAPSETLARVTSHSELGTQEEVAAAATERSP